MKKSNTFSANPKNMKFRPYKLQAMLKTFVQKFLEYVKYFFRYDLPSKNGRNLTKSNLTWQIPGAPTEYMFFFIHNVKFVWKFDYREIFFKCYINVFIHFDNSIELEQEVNTSITIISA